MLHLLRSVSNQYIELRIARPHHGRLILGEAQEPDDPLHVFLAATATELLSKGDVLKPEPEKLCVVLNLGQGAHFGRTHHLMFIKKEDRHSSRSNEFVDL